MNSQVDVSKYIYVVIVYLNKIKTCIDPVFDKFHFHWENQKADMDGNIELIDSGIKRP